VLCKWTVIDCLKSRPSRQPARAELKLLDMPRRVRIKGGKYIKMKRRVLPVLLALCLLVGLLPMTALAVNETGTAENPTMITGTTTISTGGVYQLANDVGAADIITINKDLSVTIIGAADSTKKDVAIVANANVNLTIQNLQIRPTNNTAIKFNNNGVLQIVGTNSLAGGINGDTDCGVVDIVAGEVKLQAASGSETASASLTTTTTNYAAGIRVKSGATLTIDSGIWTVTSNSSGAAIGGTGHFAKEAEAFGTIKITGGQVNAESTGRGAAIGAGGANSTGSGGKTVCPEL